MNAFIEKKLFSEPTGPFPGFLYVTMVLVSALLVCSTALAVADRRSGFDRALVPMLTLSLLLEHLTSQFRWRRSAFVALRVLYLASTALLIVYFGVCVASWVHH
jgi:hypothetical protein